MFIIITVRNEVAKIMFLHVSVCPHGGSTPRDQVHPPPWAQVHPPPGTRYPAKDQVHPQSRYTPPEPGTPPGTRYTPQDQIHPSGPGTPPHRTRYTPPPGAVHAGRYGQQAGGTHPTGMHSC